jgi:hypothetical protein
LVSSSIKYNCFSENRYLVKLKKIGNQLEDELPCVLVHLCVLFDDSSFFELF